MRYPTALFVSAVVVTSSHASLADEAPAERERAAPAAETTRLPVSIALLGGYGFNDSSGGGPEVLDVYGIGAGLRVGYTSRSSVYFGATFVQHAGYDRRLEDGRSGSARVAPLGLEVGWDLALGPVTLRPYLGFGVVLYRSTWSAGGGVFGQGQGTKQTVWPGLVATVDLGERWFVGADARYTVVATGNDSEIVGLGGGSADGLGSFATVGVRI